MTNILRSHKGLKIGLIALAAVALAVVLFAAFFDWNLLRPMISRSIAAKTGRTAAVGVDVKKLAGQGAVASALGVLLTPAAAVLAFIDPGLAKNKDCAASVSASSANLDESNNVSAK
jgi:uncharacterized protein involved in outer membrane biogenesis